MSCSLWFGFATLSKPCDGGYYAYMLRAHSQRAVFDNGQLCCIGPIPYRNARSGDDTRGVRGGAVAPDLGVLRRSSGNRRARRLSLDRLRDTLGRQLRAAGSGVVVSLRTDPARLPHIAAEWSLVGHLRDAALRYRAPFGDRRASRVLASAGADRAILHHRRRNLLVDPLGRPVEPPQTHVARLAHGHRGGEAVSGPLGRTRAVAPLIADRILASSGEPAPKGSETSAARGSDLRFELRPLAKQHISFGYDSAIISVEPAHIIDEGGQVMADLYDLLVGRSYPALQNSGMVL